MMMMTRPAGRRRPAANPFQIAFMPPPAASVIVADYNNARFIEIDVTTLCERET
jgi:hypothetical protein